MFLFGASGHGKVVADIILSSMSKITIEAIVDDNPKVEAILSIPVVKTNELFLQQKKECIICIGDNLIRRKVAEKINATYLTAIHKSAVISHFSNIGEGTVVMANAVINPDAVIGKHCIINTGAIVEHDCIIEDFVHISPNASLAGAVTVGEGSHIGIGACVIQGIKIGKWATIGAGAVVIKNVPDYAVVVGNPATKLSF
jgi:acetyltransferase EpsM